VSVIDDNDTTSEAASQQILATRINIMHAFITIIRFDTSVAAVHCERRETCVRVLIIYVIVVLYKRRIYTYLGTYDARICAVSFTSAWPATRQTFISPLWTSYESVQKSVFAGTNKIVYKYTRTVVWIWAMTMILDTSRRHVLVYIRIQGCC